MTEGGDLCERDDYHCARGVGGGREVASLSPLLFVKGPPNVTGEVTLCGVCQYEVQI